MSLWSSSTASRPPVTHFAAMRPGFTQIQQILVSPSPPFSCPFPPFLLPVLDHCHFPVRFAPFSLLPMLKYFCTLQLEPFPPFHPPLPLVPLYTACTASSDVCPYPYLFCLVDEVPEDVIKLLDVCCAITFTDVADQRCIRRASV